MPLNQILRKNSHVLWTISVIQDQNPDAQTKSEFAEMANDVINTNTIDQVTLCLADNLQRFRFMINDGLTEEEAIKHCQYLSDSWRNDNSQTLEKLKETKKVSFLTWQEFFDWPMYSQTIKEIENLYKQNKEFRNDVDGRVRLALKDIKPDAKISHPIQQTDLLKKYLFEECAFQKFGSSKGFKYEIYKNQHCKAMRRIKNNSDFVLPGYMIEVYFTQFDLSVKKQNTNGNIISPEKQSFSPMFNKLPARQSLTVDISISIKFAEFIEKTLEMLPQKEREKAVEELMKFTIQEILPRYLGDSSVLKI